MNPLKASSLVVLMSIVGCRAEYSGEPMFKECRPLNPNQDLPTYRMHTDSIIASYNPLNNHYKISFKDLNSGEIVSLDTENPTHHCYPEEEDEPAEGK